MAISLDTVKSIVASFDSKPSSSEAENNHNQARRLWYRFKEYHLSCACGIMRLSSPVPNDLVGIVTEDLLGMDIKTSKGVPSQDREMLKDDLSEIHGGPAFFQSSTIQPNAERGKAPKRPCLSQKVEMTLIEPQTKEIFKGSQGGEFG